MSLFEKRLPLAVQIFLICAGLAAFVTLIGGLRCYFSYRESLINEVESRLKWLARAAASQVNVPLHESIENRKDESTAAYVEIKSVLRGIRKANPDIGSIYTLRPTEKRDIWEYVVDSEYDPEKVRHVGEKIKASEFRYLMESWSGSVADHIAFEDERGRWLSGYAPVKNPFGETIAVVRVDISAKELEREQYLLYRAIVESIIYALVLAIIPSLLITRGVLRSVHTFTDAASRVRNGDLDFQIEKKKGWAYEIDDFSNAFNSMIRSLKESRQKLVEQSTRDFLTGLFNHRYFQERLSSEINRAQRYRHNLCLLIIDVDRFKSINDTFGHPVGDSILLQISQVLLDNIRDIDVAARYAGDELAFSYALSDLDTGIQVAERIREAIESHHFVPLGIGEEIRENPPRINVTVTIGLAQFPDDHATREGLIMAADIALCRAKHVSRNSVCAFASCGGNETHLDPEHLYQILRDPNAAAVQSLSAAVDAKDSYTKGHSERVTTYAVEMGKMLGLDSQTLDALQIAGLLHDLGKIGVPDSILNKQGSLTKDEKEAIRKHPSVGGDILSRAPQLEIVVPSVLYHHERWDGAGYPNGLSGESIPVTARILAIADAFDAMITDRPYRKAMTIESALIELRASAGKQFDPELVEKFIEMITQRIQKEKAA